MTKRQMVGDKSSKTAARDSRQFAALHCANYRICIDEAAAEDQGVQCHHCNKMDKMWNAYQKEIDTTLFSRSGGGEQAIGPRGKTSCPVDASGTGYREKKTMKEKLDTIETQVCKDPECSSAGGPSPIDDFQIHGPSGQRMGVCRDCMGRKMSAGKKNKTSAAKTEKQKPGKKDRKEELGNRKEKKAAPEPPSVPASSPPSISIDFSGYEELLDLIRLVAEAEERTVEKQLFYWIKKMDINKLQRYLDDGPSVLS